MSHERARQTELSKVVVITPEKQAKVNEHAKKMIVATAVTFGTAFISPPTSLLISLELLRQGYLTVKNIE